jgi:hypothetical protein
VGRRAHTRSAPSDEAIGLMAAISLILLAWAIGEFLRSI